VSFLAGIFLHGRIFLFLNFAYFTLTLFSAVWLFILFYFIFLAIGGENFVRGGRTFWATAERQRERRDACFLLHPEKS
jgi:hypothetical protein